MFSALEGYIGKKEEPTTIEDFAALESSFEDEVAEEGLKDTLIDIKDAVSSFVLRWRKTFMVISGFVFFTGVGAVPMAIKGLSFLKQITGLPINSKLIVSRLVVELVAWGALFHYVTFAKSAAPAIKEILQLKLPNDEDELIKYKAKINAMFKRRFKQGDVTKSAPTDSSGTLKELGYTPANITTAIDETKKIAQDFKNTKFIEGGLMKLAQSPEAASPYGRQGLAFATSRINYIIKKYAKAAKVIDHNLTKLNKVGMSAEKKVANIK